MILTRAQIVLQTDLEKRLTSSIGSLLQGALMQHIDPAYGEVLHRSELQPYSQYISFGASGAIWTVQTLTEEAETQIVQPLLSGSFTSLRLEHKDLKLPILSDAANILCGMFQKGAAAFYNAMFLQKSGRISNLSVHSADVSKSCEQI